MATLLDLLSSSEARSERAEDPKLRPNHQGDEVPELGPTRILPAGPAPANPVRSPQTIVENRFAEHIVHGMSKRGRS